MKEFGLFTSKVVKKWHKSNHLASFNKVKSKSLMQMVVFFKVYGFHDKKSLGTLRKFNNACLNNFFVLF